MTDIVDTKTRSRIMSQIKGQNTKPEMEIRKRLFVMGFRYRIHYKKLPGKPDLAFAKYNAVVMINGCFWHYHDCDLFKMPSTRRSWWKNKLEGNRIRDRKNLTKLQDLGWRILIIWECSWRKKERLKEFSLLAKQIASWLKGNGKFKEIRG